MEVCRPGVVGHERARGESEDRLDLGAHVDRGHLVVGRVHVRDGRQLLHEVPVSALQSLELELGFLPLGDVEEEPEDVLGFAVVVADGRRRVADPDDPPVVAHHPVLERERLARADALHRFVPRAVAVLRVDPLRPLFALGPGGASEQVVDLRAHKEVAEALVGHVDVRHDRELLDERAVALLDVGRAGLGLLLARDVDDEADPVGRVDPPTRRRGPLRRGPRRCARRRSPTGTPPDTGPAWRRRRRRPPPRAARSSGCTIEYQKSRDSTNRSGGYPVSASIRGLTYEVIPSGLRFRRTPRPAWTRARDGSRGRGWEVARI